MGNIKSFYTYIVEQTDDYTEVVLDTELNSDYARTFSAYKKFITDLKSFSEESELNGKFSRHSKNPSKFKYVYTKRRSQEVKSIEFTIEEFNLYNKFMSDYKKNEDIVDKFESID